MVARRIRIWGRVQGVLFRDSARRRARKLGLTGYAKNLADESLEIVAQGDAQAIDEFFSWAKHGPPFAHVERLEIQEIQTNEMVKDFVIR